MTTNSNAGSSPVDRKVMRLEPYGFLYLDKNMMTQFSHTHPDKYEQFNMDCKPIYSAAQVETLRREVAGFREALECEKTHGAQRNFVLGAKWWQAHKNGATAFASECDEMDRAAVNRYGLPQRFADGMTAEDDRRFLEATNDLTHNVEFSERSAAGAESAGTQG